MNLPVVITRRPKPNRRSPSKPPSEAQIAARERSWKIFKVRGLWYMAYALSEPRRTAMQALVDEELTAMGAEPEGERRAKRDAELNARLEAQIREEELPF